MTQRLCTHQSQPVLLTHMLKLYRNIIAHIFVLSLFLACIVLVFYLYCTCLVLCLYSYPLWERLLIIGPQFRACIILILCLYSTCIVLIFLPPMGTIIDYWSSIPCLYHTYIVLVFYLYCTYILTPYGNDY